MAGLDRPRATGIGTGGNRADGVPRSRPEVAQRIPVPDGSVGATLPPVTPSDASVSRPAATPLFGLVAVLRHEPATGEPHHDLLIHRGEPPADEDRVVACWRVPVRPDLAAAGTVVPVERIADHRGLYLRLSEARRLDRGRGTVTPLRRGTISAVHVAADGAESITVDWRDGGRSAWKIDGSRLAVVAATPRAGESP
jgi:hypothetical protein